MPLRRIAEIVTVCAMLLQICGAIICTSQPSLCLVASTEREMAISARATNRITTAPSGYCGNGVSTSRRHQAPSMLERNMEGFFGIDWGRHDRRRSSALLR
jgi:hypothetical protein